MSTGHLPPRHRAAGPQGFGRDPHPSGPIPVPLPRKPPEGSDGDAVVRFTPLAARVPAPRFPTTAPLPVGQERRRRRRVPFGVVCVLAVLLAAGVSVLLVSLRTVPPSLPSPLPTVAPPTAAAPPATAVGSVGDGTFAVGRAIAPGAYRAPGGPSCHWSRLTPTGTVRASGEEGRVTVRPSDGAFRSAGCGVWRAAS